MATAVTRKSGRQRKANTKYAHDLLEKEILRRLRESSESSKPTSPDTTDSEKPNADPQFDLGQVWAEGATARHLSDDDDLSMVSGSGRHASDGSDIRTPNDSEDDKMTIATSGISGPEDYEGYHKKPKPKSVPRDAPEIHSRGLANVPKHSAKEYGWTSMYAPNDEEMAPILHVRDQWTGREDVTFPSRKTLADVARLGLYGKTVRFGLSEEELNHELSRDWDWYYEEQSGERFRKRQRIEAITDRARHERHFRSAERHHKLVMGPKMKQQLTEVGFCDAIDFGKVWETIPEQEPQMSLANEDGVAMDVDNDARTEEHSTLKPPSSGLEHTRERSQAKPGRYHEGWILNLGQKVLCLAWAPNRWEDSTQYLAVSTLCTSVQLSSVKQTDDRIAPAFKPSPPYPSSIQIWSFRASAESDRDLHRLEQSSSPRLVQVICTDWGNIRRLTWCPMLREERKAEPGQAPPPCSSNLGLLGTITSDGIARVLDCIVPKARTETETQFVHVHHAAFEANPPASSIFTSLVFASATDLILGTSAGSYGIYDIRDPEDDSAPEPAMTHFTTDGYLLSLAMAYPSASPTFLATLSTSGATTLTDLRCPTQDTVVVSRSRLPLAHLAYSPHANVFITTVDGAPSMSSTPASQSALVCHHTRRFFQSTMVARIPGGGLATNIAVSRWHPCVLAGTASGTVVCTNYLRKALPGGARSSGRKGSSYIQKLCEYDWMPVTNQEEPAQRNTTVTRQRDESNMRSTPDSPSSSPSSSSTPPQRNATANSDSVSKYAHQNDDAVFHGHDSRPGISRFHEGFTAERIDFTRGGPPRSKSKSKGKSKPRQARNRDEAGIETIYEEEQAVTAMDWNPNLACAGWVAVGWGSGIVRVQDVAL